jgi:hypothetical protein
MATSKSSSMVSVRITPGLSEQRVDGHVGMPAREPVCELAARAPAAVRPLFTATMGFLRDTSEACA